VLLERDDQLAALRERLADVAAGRRGRLAFVTGEAGIGKTSFVRRFCDGVRSEARTLWGSPLPPAPVLPKALTVDVPQLPKLP
jgi:tRNA A37 threonylcarbamoyladenosine biosynthesis protein TsaE